MRARRPAWCRHARSVTAERGRDPLVPGTTRVQEGPVAQSWNPSGTPAQLLRGSIPRLSSPHIFRSLQLVALPAPPGRDVVAAAAGANSAPATITSSSSASSSLLGHLQRLCGGERPRRLDLGDGGGGRAHTRRMKVELIEAYVRDLTEQNELLLQIVGSLQAEADQRIADMMKNIVEARRTLRGAPSRADALHRKNVAPAGGVGSPVRGCGARWPQPAP
ncbi:unnamed protein product [Lampetra fluviatilis]